MTVLVIADEGSQTVIYVRTPGYVQ